MFLVLLYIGIFMVYISKVKFLISPAGFSDKDFFCEGYQAEDVLLGIAFLKNYFLSAFRNNFGESKRNWLSERDKFEYYRLARYDGNFSARLFFFAFKNAVHKNVKRNPRLISSKATVLFCF